MGERKKRGTERIWGEKGEGDRKDMGRKRRGGEKGLKGEEERKEQKE